jgi:hypothetical protein
MSQPENANPQPRFSRRSERESICMFCFVSVQTDRYVPLEEVEDIHADVCLVRPDDANRYPPL